MASLTEAWLDDLSSTPDQRRAKRQRVSATTEATIPPSLLGRIGESSLSGISAVGNILDVPGSMVRDVAVGKNPLDQLLSPFSSKNRTTGREALKQYGVLGRNKKGLDVGDVAGFGLEVAADPLTYLTFGASALSKGGKIAKSAGLLDNAAGVASKTAGKQVGKRVSRLTTTLDDLIAAGGPQAKEAAERAAQGMGTDLASISGEKLGGMVGTPLGVFGQGPKAQRIAGAMDKAGEAVRFAKVPGTNFQPVNALANLFDAPAKDTKTPFGQTMARKLFREKEAGRASVREEVTRYVDTLERNGMATGDQSRILRKVLEGVNVPDAIPDEVRSMVDEIKGKLGTLPDEFTKRGMKLEKLVDPEIDYFPRFESNRPKVPNDKSGRVFSDFDPSRIKRRDFLRGIEGGTDTIIELAKDPALNQLIDSGAGKKDIVDFIASNYGNKISPDYLPRGADPSVTKPLKRYPRLAAFLAKRTKESREAGIFGNHPILDLQGRLQNAKDALVGNDIVMEALSSPGILNAATDAARVEGSISVKELFQKLDLNHGDETGGALYTLAKRFGDDVDKMDPKIAGEFLQTLGSKRIRADLADDLARYVKGFTSPEPASEIMKAVDSVTNLFKTGVTAIWPNFHVRNLFSGQFNNFVAGTFSPESVKDATKLMRGQPIEGAAKIPVVQKIARERGIQGLTDEQATRILGDLAYSHRLVGRFEGEGANVAGRAANMSSGSIEDLLSEIPGRRPVTAKSMLSNATSANPLNVRGVGERMESTFAPAAVGQNIGHFVEGLNRLAPFIEQLKKGVDPLSAAQKVGAAQVEYSSRHYTKFEQEAMSRLFPFFKFARQQLPWTIRQLIETPGGKLAQTIRGANRARNPNELTPDYIAETAAVPLGSNGENDRYLTGFGLAFENPLGFNPVGPLYGDLRTPLGELGSQLNPAIKAPLEYALGRTFFQRGPQGGRDLQDLDPTLGRLAANVTGQEKPVRFPGSELLEVISGNLPTAKLATTARQLTDPRKGVGTKAMNALTGLRITDVSPAAQDAMLRERVQELMRQLGGKTFNRSYIPAEDFAAMSPKEKADALALKELNDMLAMRAKKRKAEKAKK
jgi:hypothetical protein